MEPWFQVILTIFSSVLASSGLWAYLQKKSEQKDVKTEMLIGYWHMTGSCILECRILTVGV